MGESVLEVSNLIIESRKLSKVTRLSSYISKPWLKANLKDINNLINNQTFPVTPCMDIYKANIQSDGSIDKLKWIIVVIGDLQNKDLIGETLSPTSSMRTLKQFLAYDFKHKSIVRKLDFIGALL